MKKILNKLRLFFAPRWIPSEDACRYARTEFRNDQDFIYRELITRGDIRNLR